MRRGNSVRAYVVRLVVAVALPLLVFGAFLLIRSADHEQHAIATTAHERALGAAADLDRELRHLEDLVSILADSDYLSVSDATISRRYTMRSLRDPMLGLVVRSLSGEPLFNTCTADVRPFPVSAGIADALYEADSAKSHISELATEPTTGEHFFTIDLPVRRGESVLVFSLCVLPRILQILTEQHLPNGWTAAVLDNRGRTIASITESASGRHAIAGSDDTMVSAIQNDPVTAHGGGFEPGYEAFSPVLLAGWTVSISVPGEIFSAPVRRAVLVLLVAGGGTLALMLALAVTIGRRIAGSLIGLTAIARSMGVVDIRCFRLPASMKPI